jgi:hypothetical protein
MPGDGAGAEELRDGAERWEEEQGQEQLLVSRQRKN